jgi:aspartate racemase
MKTIGILGGMSWESTIEYYRLLNSEVNRRLGGLHSARCIMVSVDFDYYARCLKAKNWRALKKNLVHEARRLERAGADMVLLATNTMHLFAEDITRNIDVPLIHIADATAAAIQKKKIHTVGLLGSQCTMEMDFYKKRLRENYGINALVPDQNDRRAIDKIIFGELCKGLVKAASRNKLGVVIKNLEHRGVQGIVLGCTELPLILKPQDFQLPLWDTMQLHVLKAVECAIRFN